MSRLTWRRVAVGLALVGVGVAVWDGYAPGSLPDAVDTLGADRSLALAFAGAVAGVIGLLYAWLTERDATTPISERADGAPKRRATVAGADLTAYYERAVEDGGADGIDRDPLRRRLRAVVVESVRDEHDDATTAVDRGTWTDDRYAAAFLTAATAVDYPWYHRLYAWLYPERAYERRVRRTLAAAERTAAERLSGFEAPEPPDGAGPRRRLRALHVALEGSS